MVELDVRPVRSECVEVILRGRETPLVENLVDGQLACSPAVSRRLTSTRITVPVHVAGTVTVSHLSVETVRSVKTPSPIVTSSPSASRSRAAPDPGVLKYINFP